MNKQSEYVEYLIEQLKPLGAVRARRMFGGYGIYLDALMFGIVAEDVLYLKVDEVSRPEFEAEGLEAFTFSRGEKTFAMSYHRAPDEAVDDREVLVNWAEKGHAAALREAAKKAKRQGAKTKRKKGSKKTAKTPRPQRKRKKKT